jgi:hypothetical protein
MAEARIEMSAADRNVLALTQSIAGGFDKIVASMERTERRSASLQQSTDRMFGSISSGVRGFTTDIGKLALGLAGVQSAGAMIMAEYDKFRQKLSTSAQVGGTFAGSIAAATRNAPDGMTGLQIEHMAKSSAIAAGIEPTQVAAALPGMFAAGGGGVSAEKYAQIAAAGGPLSFGSPSDYSALLAGTAGYMSKAGAAGKDLEPQQVMGFLQSASKGSRVDLMKDYGPAMGVVHSASLAKGFDFPESAAIYNSLTQGADDSAGDKSRTATLQYLTALDHARKALGMPKEASPKRIIAALQKPENAAARAVFLRELKGEQSHIDLMRSTVTPGSVGDQVFQTGFAGTPSMAGGEAAYNATVSNLTSSPSISAMLPAEAIKGATQGMVLDPQRIEAGAVEAAFEGYNAAGSGLAISDAIDMAQYRAHVARGGDATDFVRGRLQTRATTLRTPRSGSVDAEGVPMSAGYTPGANEIRQAEALERLIETLNRIDNSSKAQTVAPNGDRPALPGNTPSGGWWDWSGGGRK